MPVPVKPAADGHSYPLGPLLASLGPP